MTAISVKTPNKALWWNKSISVLSLWVRKKAPKQTKERIAYLKSIPDDKITMDEALELLDWPGWTSYEVNLPMEEFLQQLKEINNEK